jgi:hypothetical protein
LKFLSVTPEIPTAEMPVPWKDLGFPSAAPMTFAPVAVDGDVRGFDRNLPVGLGRVKLRIFFNHQGWNSRGFVDSVHQSRCLEDD